MTTEEKKSRFLEYYAELPIQKLAAGFAGVSEDTITNWKKADAEFSDQVELAKSEWARKTASQVKSKEWLLERTMKDHFAEKKEVEVNLPKPLLDRDVSKDNSNSENNPTDQTD